MAGQRDIIYSVLAMDATGWNSHGTVHDMHNAMSSAEKLFESGRYSEVKVEKAFFDPANKRQVTTTILERKRENKKSYLTFYLLAFAVLVGILSFAITYILAGSYT